MTSPFRQRLSKVFTLGNKLTKTMPRSAAFKTAWRIVLRGGLDLRVAGVTFGNRQEALRRLATYNPTDVKAFLLAEPDNPADHNAIAVYAGVNGGRGFYRLGYVPVTQTDIAAAFIGRTPSFRVLTGDTRGARLSFTL
jgi:hypothetical protein